ncbi:MAG: thiamine pyrophosphate-binding protein [archaeon]|nr:thiamine pyrophosphate-binding protein [archaeon]
MQERTVSEVIVDQLAAWGVEYIFGLPGTTCLGVVDAIRKQNKIRFIKVRHEEAAALMASAYAKLTGKVGVCVTIAGPGATNLKACIGRTGRFSPHHSKRYPKRSA